MHTQMNLNVALCPKTAPVYCQNTTSFDGILEDGTTGTETEYGNEYTSFDLVD